ncbi:hypothetical protein ABFV83_01160 [Lacrimispora sp. BS-2]|uniref:Uncharacterized protein n=1 Tax=Lacrimispora sp. BS-2 TaxID=3151850 RepID=A0AAU7PRS4_9FIRM
MRIEHGNPYGYDVNRNLTREPLEKQKDEKESYMAAMSQQLETSGEQTKAEREKLKILLNCLEISRRIAGGDKVPPADHQYLMKHDSALYARSVMMRFPKNNPHEYKRLTQERERQSNPQDQMTNEGENFEGLKEPLIQCSGARVDVSV